ARETVPRMDISRATGMGSGDTNKTASRMALSSRASMASVWLFIPSTPASFAASPGTPLSSRTAAVSASALSFDSCSMIELMLPSIQHHPILPGLVRVKNCATREWAQMFCLEYPSRSKPHQFQQCQKCDNDDQTMAGWLEEF